MARRYHSVEFKREAVRAASKPGLSRRQAARELGIHPDLLRNWQQRFDEDKWQQAPDTALKSAQDSKIVRLRRENARLKTDLEILKKAAAYFAKESK